MMFEIIQTKECNDSTIEFCFCESFDDICDIKIKSIHFENYDDYEYDEAHGIQYCDSYLNNWWPYSRISERWLMSPDDMDDI